MHFHAEHSLFFERRHSLWRPVLSLVLTAFVLLVNVGMSDMMVSLTAAGVAMLLLVDAYVRGHHRLDPALTWTLALVVSVLLSGFALGGDLTHFTEVAVRIACGVLWVLWLGTQMDWSSLRRILLRLRVPENVVGPLDHAVMNGVLTQRERVLRRDAARLRIGQKQLSMGAWAKLLGEGALGSFLRLENVEESGLLRSSSVSNAEWGDVVHLDSVNIERDGHLILEQLDFRIGSGEWVLLCGPSGAGKSSLLRVLAGLDDPGSGTMNRLGVTVSPGATLPTRLDGRVALLTQNPEHHFIASTVVEDIAWGLLRRGVGETEAHRRSAEMARLLKVDHLLERPCHSLSFGEQRRVALTGLLVLEPALLLLDEPTSGLDPVAAFELRTLVEQCVQRTGAACIWATHDLHSLPPQANRVVLLRDRRVLFDGDITEGTSNFWLQRAGLWVPEVGGTSC